MDNDSAILKPNNYHEFLIDLVLYISVMFLIRELYFQEISFIANGLFWSITCFAVATWRMRSKNIHWKDLGLKKPKNIGKTIGISIGVFVAVIGFIIIFEILKDCINMPFSIDTSSEDTSSKFGNLKDNWLQFFLIIPFIWLESMLEELLDRGFIINWLEKVFSKLPFATLIAVILQASIFGFRHSNDFSERSITVGIIGLVMGIAYVKFGRNLWPIIIAHCILNTISMIERV